jgi:hypothetical protein
VVLELTPLVLKPVPVVVTPETVRSEFPVLVNTTLSEVSVLKSTLPKFRLVALAPRVTVELVDVPVRGMVMGELETLLVTAMDPVKVATTVGLNVAVNVALPPAAIVGEGDKLDALKPLPDADTAVTVTLAVPPFFKVIVCELVLPVATLPNGTLAGVADSVP